jgi:hypothetical protein
MTLLESQMAVERCLQVQNRRAARTARAVGGEGGVLLRGGGVLLRGGGVAARG